MAGQPYPFDGTFEIANGEGEVLLAELADDIDVYDDPLPTQLVGECQVDTGVTVRIRLRIGGTPGSAADGTIAASINKTNTALEAFEATGTPANPGGNVPLKLTGEVIAGTGNATIRSCVASLDPLTPGADITDPVVTFNPPDMTTINRYQSIGVTVTDETGLRAVMLWAVFSTGFWEMIHDNDNFSPAYDDESTRSIVAGGFAFNLKRRGGWPSAPLIRCKSIDLSGNEGVE